ncbi:PQQ-dependent sugar dehydrogenase [Corallococcus llansteffanensis]|uniref:Sorbosone dehydrogenase family protein n=1 Tax=Corallococcus llansteffanensis TaxID=2316731 RepID=A0A3A8QCR3_9BACT|nr:sorbosone dehydrogenase family protein [Corallococcus llansteffanensis]RKH62572.1 sorbosone dehydrogenase family protein [Corallococcus llansteffanensis]
MTVLPRLSLCVSAALLLADCAHRSPPPSPSEASTTLPAPDPSFKVQRYSSVVGWPEGRRPQAPEGFEVTRFASDLRNPRWTYVLPNGDVLVAEASSEFKNEQDKQEAIESGKVRSQNLGNSANRITLLRDADRDGTPEVREVFLEGLKQPLGMLLLGDQLYVAHTDGVWRYPYTAGETVLLPQGQKVLDLPAGGYNNHWTRNLLANADGTKLYVSVGSASNVAEHGLKEEERRANILEINPDGTGERVFASGLRNPVGMGWAPGTRVLWAVVNERDDLGEDLVPDYLTHVEDGAFYGWPFAYFGANEDPRLAGQRPDLVKQTRVPDVALGAHTASLGLAFYDAQAFPKRYQGGAFIGQHGSWNRSELSGYKVVFVPFTNGRPSGPPEDFLTGFIADAAQAQVYGRPVGITLLPDGALLVADDASNTLWKVSAKHQP